jgi:predicted DNA-binding transcriptional regulator AlpA
MRASGAAMAAARKSLPSENSFPRPGFYIDQKSLRARVPVSPSTLRRLIKAGHLPAPTKLGDRKGLWLETDIAAALAKFTTVAPKNEFGAPKIEEPQRPPAFVPPADADPEFIAFLSAAFRDWQNAKKASSGEAAR